MYPEQYEVFNVNHSLNQNPQFFPDSEVAAKNLLSQYLQSMSPEVVAHLSRPNSPEVFQVMEQNIIGLLGGLPSEYFNVSITTNRENLSRLLASAMMSGYFLRNAEQRMAFEQSLQVE
jgi:hypothetical protein